MGQSLEQVANPALVERGAPQYPRGVERTVLENGIRILTEEIPGSQSVALGVVVDCGSADDEEGGEGLAHLCEHLLFQGTSSRDALHIGRQIDAAGGQIGAFTARDYTCFYASILSGYSFHVLELLGDIFLNSTFPEESLVREKRAVLSELEAGSDVPSQWVHEHLKRRAWPDHSLGRPVIGEAAALESITRDDVIYYFHKHYTPDRIIVAAAGRIRHDAFVAEVRDSFWRAVGQNHRRPAAAPHFHGGYSAGELNTSMSYFAFGLEAPAYASELRFVTHLFSVILGEGMSSRLFQTLREDLGLVYAVGSEYHGYRLAGMLAIEGCAAPQNVDVVCRRILEILARMADGAEPVTEDELSRAKSYLSSQYIVSSENVNTRMSRLAVQELYQGHVCAPEEILGRIESITVQAMAEFVRDWVAPRLESMHVVTAGPGAPAPWPAQAPDGSAAAETTGSEPLKARR